MPSINSQCKLCPLHESAQTVCVSGSGPLGAEIMIVGEAPSASEDDVGIPFVGKAGQLLDTLLAQQGFRRDEIYITNAVKCRPPNNRDPKASEIKACKTYLQTEINAMLPRIIVALGNTALRSLTGESGITKHRGSLLPLHSSFGSDTTEPRVFGATHPAAGLYYPDSIEQVEDDIRLLRHTVNDDFIEIEIDWEEGQQSNILYSDVFSFDLETNALETRSPFCRAYLCAIDSGRGPVQVFEDVAHAVWILSSAHYGHKIRLVGHNSSGFDRLHARIAEQRVELKCDDTMLMGWLLHEHWGAAKKLNLEALCVAELGVKPWKKDVTWDWRKPADIPWPEAKLYNARDTRLTRLLFFRLATQLKADGQLWNVYDKLLLPASRALANMEERGLYVNNQRVAEARAYYESEQVRLLGEIQQIALNAGMDAKFNPGSTKQVGTLLYDLLEMPILSTTPTGKPATNVSVLKNLREQLYEFGGQDAAPVFDAILNYRKVRNKMLGTYIAHYEQQQDYWQMAYPSYSLISTVTGRTAGPWQQIPREPRIRSCVGVPPGYVLIEADYSQLEMRTAASKHVFDEPNLREAFANDVDVHALLASEIHGIPLGMVTRQQRQDAKPANFLFLYGGEEQMYMQMLLDYQDVVKPFAHARAERNAFFHRWSGLPAGHERVVRELQRNGQVRTLFGTLRRLPNVFSERREVVVASFREAVNAKVQTPTCHMALIGLVLLDAAGLSVRSFQHDGYLIWVQDSEAAVRRAAAQIRYLLERGVPEVMAAEFGIDWDVPLKVDLKAGTGWTLNDRAAWVSGLTKP